MQPSEFPKLQQALANHFQALMREPPNKGACEHWFDVLRRFLISDIERALIAHAAKGKFPATPSHIVERCEASEADRRKSQLNAQAPGAGDPAPSWATLMRVRSTLNHLGEKAARQQDGDVVVNILKANPCLGYDVLDPRGYPDGRVPEALQQQRGRLIAGRTPLRFGEQMKGVAE